MSVLLVIINYINRLKLELEKLLKCCIQLFYKRILNRMTFFKLLFSEFLLKYVIDKKQFEKGKA